MIDRNETIGQEYSHVVVGLVNVLYVTSVLFRDAVKNLRQETQLVRFGTHIDSSESCLNC